VSVSTLPSFSVARSVTEFRSACDAVRASGETLGLVPTMGALHAGHLSLVAEARRHATRIAVTIFVNPTQFGPSEDLSRYPRPLEKDLALCREAGASLVFTPPEAEMYPAGDATRVHVARLTDSLCGPFRPGHFDGVATVVSKLFAVAGPSVAVFGRKDYQQLAVVRRMVKDLLLPITLVGYPTVRDADGLALSSRNAYLSADERERALAVPLALSAVVHAHARGERNVGKLRGLALSHLEPAATRIDYLSIADADDLAPLADTDQLGERALVATAVFVGKTRLIDNVVLGEDRAPRPEEP
jgi:pantoate--beta-alanine ligase